MHRRPARSGRADARDPVTSDDLRTAVARMHAQIGPIRDTLNAADRALGDGDCGMTVEQVVGAWHAASADLSGADVGEALRRLAKETRRCSGSSLGSVAAIGLAAAGKAAAGTPALDRAGLVDALAAADAAIVERSGAAAGDKTVLDSLQRIGAELRTCGDDADLLAVSVRAAEAAMSELRDRPCRLGRARMYGDGSVGRDDPGMIAAVLLLRAAQGTNPA